MKAHILNTKDNVAVVSENIKSGQVLAVNDGKEIIAVQDIPGKHKITLENIDQGGMVIRYGEPIGIATTKITAGSWVHSHNLAPLESKASIEAKGVPEKSESFLKGPMTFMGYSRLKGPAGIRNHVLLLPVVACANSVVRSAAKQLPDATPLEHTGGCGRAGADNTRTMRVLEGLGTHPNVAAVVLVGLGCEFLKGNKLFETISASGRPVKYFNIQEAGGSVKTTKLVVDACRLMIEDVKQQTRSPQPLSDLTIGLECGGSDALSGVTANPTVGLVSDWFVHQGAGVILSETTELIGADHLMLQRCRNAETAEKLKEIIEKNRQISKVQLGDFAHLAISPGNQDGGLSTITEKSLGCITKGGTNPVEEVLSFGQKPSSRGLVIMDTPGYDLESISGKAAGGCQAILFTTGRGTPVGNSIAPTIKIASNNNLWENLEDDLDLSCGDIITSSMKLEDAAQSALNFLVDVSNGKLCKSEINEQTAFALSFRIEAL